MSLVWDAVISFMRLEQLLETAAVRGVQRVHLLGGRPLASCDSERRADDCCDGTRERKRADAVHQRNSEPEHMLQRDLHSPQTATEEREITLL